MRESIAAQRAAVAAAAQSGAVDDASTNVLFSASLTTSQTVMFSTIGALCTLLTKILDHVAILGVDLTMVVVPQPFLDFVKTRALMASMRELIKRASAVALHALLRVMRAPCVCVVVGCGGGGGGGGGVAVVVVLTATCVHCRLEWAQDHLQHGFRRRVHALGL